MTPCLRIADVQDLIGKPYQLGARGPDAFDCWGLCAEVYRRGGIVLPEFRAECMTHAQRAALVDDLADDHVDLVHLPDDWCFVYVRREGHIGVHWRGSVLHCARPHGTVLQRLDLFRRVHPGVEFARWRA
jgi:cell wall-associated NlpC family hydrolase